MSWMQGLGLVLWIGTAALDDDSLLHAPTTLRIS
jgi:hypothetical protein